jgi:hypothetical protein
MTLKVTIEAIMYGLRRGLSCLDDPNNKARLRDCDDAAMKEITARLRDMYRRSNGARPNWSQADIDRLIAVRKIL